MLPTITKQEEDGHVWLSLHWRTDNGSCLIQIDPAEDTAEFSWSDGSLHPDRQHGTTGVTYSLEDGPPEEVRRIFANLIESK